MLIITYGNCHHILFQPFDFHFYNPSFINLQRHTLLKVSYNLIVSIKP